MLQNSNRGLNLGLQTLPQDQGDVTDAVMNGNNHVLQVHQMLLGIDPRIFEPLGNSSSFTV